MASRSEGVETMEGRLTVGAAATAAGLSAKAVRLYEARGLVPPAERTPAGYRLYTASDVAVLRFIRQARVLGLDLAEIRRILNLRRSGTIPCEAVHTLLDDKIDQIDRTIADLTALRTALTATRSAGTDDEKAVVCPVIEHAVVV